MSFSLPDAGSAPPRWTNPETFDRIAERLRILAHPHRLRMVEMLLAGKFSVGELAGSCSIPSHMASEHLRLMQHCGLLGSEKEGRYTFYRIAEPNLERLLVCLKDQQLRLDDVPAYSSMDTAGTTASGPSHPPQHEFTLGSESPETLPMQPGSPPRVLPNEPTVPPL